jgi:hypothetical protein
VVLDRFAWILDGLTKVFGTLPFSSTSSINTGIYELIVIYCLIFSLVIYFRTRRVISVYFAIICILLICAYKCLDEFRQNEHYEITVLSVEGMTAINFISGSHNTVLTDDTSLISREKIVLHCTNYWRSSDLEDPEFVHIHNGQNRYLADNKLYLSGYQRDGIIFIQFCNTKIGILSDGYGEDKKELKSLKLDLLIINAKYPIDMVTLMQDVRLDLMVIDRQVPSWNAEKLEMICLQNGIPFHNVKLKGYFKLDL